MMEPLLTLTKSEDFAEGQRHTTIASEAKKLGRAQRVKKDRRDRFRRRNQHEEDVKGVNRRNINQQMCHRFS